MAEQSRAGGAPQERHRWSSGNQIQAERSDEPAGVENTIENGENFALASPCSWKSKVSSHSSCSSGLKSEVLGKRFLPHWDTGKISSEGNGSITFDASFETHSWSSGIYFLWSLKLNVFIDCFFLEELQLLGQTSLHSAVLIPLGARSDWQGALVRADSYPKVQELVRAFQREQPLQLWARRIFLLSTSIKSQRKVFPACLWWQDMQRQPVKLIPLFSCCPR